VELLVNVADEGAERCGRTSTMTKPSEDVKTAVTPQATPVALLPQQIRNQMIRASSCWFHVRLL